MPPTLMPVSYTHLDVYKRQTRTRRLAAAYIALAAAVAVLFALNLFWGSVSPVSYTHLDVYKRQLLHCI